MRIHAVFAVLCLQKTEDNPMTAAEYVAQLAEQLLITQRFAARVLEVYPRSCRYFASPTGHALIGASGNHQSLLLEDMCMPVYSRKSRLIFPQRQSEPEPRSSPQVKKMGEKDTGRLDQDILGELLTSSA